jgi:predicted site-specific integrase-resolvase
MSIDFNTLPELLSIPAVAEMLGLSRASAYRYAESGELPCRRLGGRIYVVKNGLRDLLDTDNDSPRRTGGAA